MKQFPLRHKDLGIRIPTVPFTWSVAFDKGLISLSLQNRPDVFTLTAQLGGSCGARCAGGGIRPAPGLCLYGVGSLKSHHPLSPGLLETTVQKVARVKAPNKSLPSAVYCIEDKM